MQPLVPDHAYMPHIKAVYVPFQMVHGTSICHQRLAEWQIEWPRSCPRSTRTISTKLSKNHDLNKVFASQDFIICKIGKIGNYANYLGCS